MRVCQHLYVRQQFYLASLEVSKGRPCSNRSTQVSQFSRKASSIMKRCLRLLKHSWAFAAGLAHVVRASPNLTSLSQQVLLLSCHVLGKSRCHDLEGGPSCAVDAEGFTKLGLPIAVRKAWPTLAISPSLMLAGYLLTERTRSMAKSSLQLSTSATSITCSCLARRFRPVL